VWDPFCEWAAGWLEPVRADGFDAVRAAYLDARPAGRSRGPGRLEQGCPELGSEVTVRLDRADPATRTVAFSLSP
jgi:hypothetical protein